jgi:thioredoxin reductase (NADPH)
MRFYNFTPFMEKVIIIWSWPAWHTAAIYAARANLSPLMFEWFMAWGVAAWWQLTTTTIIENFPWFPDGIDGTRLMMDMRQQSLNSWTRILTETVDGVDLSSHPFKVNVWNSIYETQSIIIATWATAKRLWIAGEEKFRQKWISACAICDGWLPIFRDKNIVVVWWWDVAVEEALHLTHFASKVTLLVRRDALRASQAMQKKLTDNPKIEILRNTEALEAIWEQFLSWLKIKNNKTDQESVLECSGLFYAIWHTPNTSFLNWQLNIDENWYLVTYGRLCDDAISWRTILSTEQEAKFKDWKQRYMTCTSVSWVFAAGDVADKKYRQAITSAWTGCMAALEVEKFLNI